MHNGTQSNYFKRYSRRGHSKSDFVSVSSPNAEAEVKKEHATSISPSEKAAFGKTDHISVSDLSGELAREIHDEFLICKICLDNFKSPKSLACLHTFCQTCIENHISAEVTYNKVTDYHHFTCPLCRKRTTLPLGGVKKLPDNFLVSGLADLLQRTRTHSSSSASTITDSKDRQQNRYPGDEIDSQSGVNFGHGRVGRISISGYGECEICGQFSDSVGRRHSVAPIAEANNRNSSSAGDETTGSPNQRAASARVSDVPKATSKCLDCNKLLCDQCVQRHRQIRVTKNHAVFKLATESAIACKDHPQEPVRYYCEACACCVCVICTFNDHREHNVSNFGEAIAVLRSELRRRIQETQLLIQRSRKWLGALDDVGDAVRKTESEIRSYADKTIDEIHKQEDALMEQLHQRVGRVTLQTIERIPDWECQVAYLESVQTEVSELLEGQDIDILLRREDLKTKLSNLPQLDFVGNLPPTVCPKIVFSPGITALGNLSFPDQHTSNLPSSRAAALSPNLPSESVPVLSAVSASCQTEDILIPTEMPKCETKEIASEANFLLTPKKFLHRAINTESSTMKDQETNTRPRGVHISIAFGGDEQFDVVKGYLNAIKNIEAAGQDSAFAAMDNLTRARLRRKLKERWSTVDTPDTSLIHTLSPSSSSSSIGIRQFSDHNPD
uniref:Tripartite motif-containing protein 2 n=1 Tax=Schistocephalus solidus TaxID=70667 RepID=A0A0X3Q2V6_SCHSO